VSDQKSGFGSGFGGPRKPKATFGDVMLGIPAGRGGEREERREDKGRRPPRPPRATEAKATAQEAPTPADAATPAAAASATPDTTKPDRPRHERKSRGPRDRHGERERKERERKPAGPLVVVKRATGVIETRPLGEATPPPPPVENAPESTEPPAAEPLAVPTPTLVKPSVADEVAESQSFAELYEAQAKHEGASAKKVYRLGEKVTGTIFQLGADTAFVSLGGHREAMIELRELKDDEGILRSGVGDTVEAHVVEMGAKGIILSRALAKGSANLARLAEARASGMPVEGLVLAVNKGGLEVAVGDVRAFCPISQIDLRFVEKPDTFVGEKLMFRVQEVRERNVVLSRRALLEEEQKAKAAETRKTLAEGKQVSGHVTGVRDFGAFVDLGGIEGMIPVSEISHVRIGHPNEVLKVGDEVSVEILRIEAAQPNSPDKAKHKERITLSLRALQEDPWKAALAELKEGSRTHGKVVRLQPFGAFVELRPGVDGLIHVSALSDRRIAHPRDAVQVGQEVEVQVEKVDEKEKRIGLRLVKDGEPVGSGVASSPEPAAAPAEAAPRPKVGDIVTGSVDRVESFGVFLKFPGGKGLIPASETGTERGTDLRRTFALGQELKAAIVEIEGGGKLRLSIPAASRAEERADMDAWKKNQPKGGGKKGFGTLGDLLKAKKLV
jgi:small subunit ribosomal protein S1